MFKTECTYNSNQVYTFHTYILIAYSTLLISLNNSLLDIDDLVASYMQKITDENHVHMWQCIECGKTSRYITNLKDHVEANHLEGLTFRCPECQKVSKSRQSLRAHMKTIHNLSSKHLKHYNH